MDQPDKSREVARKQYYKMISRVRKTRDFREESQTKHSYGMVSKDEQLSSVEVFHLCSNYPLT